MEYRLLFSFFFFFLNKMYTDKRISSQTCSHFHIYFSITTKHRFRMTYFILVKYNSKIQGVSYLSQPFFFYTHLFSSYKMAFNILHSIFNPHIILIKCLKFGNIKSVLVLCHTSQFVMGHGFWFFFFHFF